MTENIPEIPGKPRAINELTDIPAVRDYLNRIGAEVRSLRTAVVREAGGNGYKKDVATIRFAEDGTVTVTSKAGDPAEYEPTEIEKNGISAAWSGVQFPKIKLLHQLKDPPDMIRDADKDNVFEFRTLDGKEILMWQVRIEDKDGKKSYVPWTYWDDNKWRQMEPEGDLPLWGLDQLKQHNVVFLHEGAKSAAYCRRLAEGKARQDKADRENHPWGSNLEHVAHLGWIGGAPNPNRTDWSVLAKQGVERVYIIADHDKEGEAAIPKISKLLAKYNITVLAIRFPNEFPVNFDLADSFPKALFKDGAYIGPRLTELVEPATWATRPLPVASSGGKGRPKKPEYAIRDIFMSEWWMAVLNGKTVFIPDFDRTRLFSESSFNDYTRALADCPVLDKFKDKAYNRTVGGIAYAPGNDASVVRDHGTRAVNTWTPPEVKPLKNAKPEDWKSWEEFLGHLFPVEADRHEIKRWVATLIARPAVRMKYALVLCSLQQGTGKTQFCKVLETQVGWHNARSPRAKDVVESDFNSWLVRKRFIYVNEIYEDGNIRSYHKSKELVTEDEIEANEKMVAQYRVANHAHFVFCSNSPAPLAIDAKDRRLFVPQVTEETKPAEWWRDFIRWLGAGGHEAIAAWAEDFLKENLPVETGAHAPDSERKNELLEDSQSRDEKAVRDLARAALEENGVLVHGDVERWLKVPGTGKLPPPRLIRRWLRDEGLHEIGKRLKVDKRMQYVLVPPHLSHAESWPELENYRMKPEQIIERDM